MAPEPKVQDSRQWLADLQSEGVLTFSVSSDGSITIKHRREMGRMFWIGGEGALSEATLGSTRFTETMLDAKWHEGPEFGGFEAHLRAHFRASDLFAGKIDYGPDDESGSSCWLRRFITPQGVVFAGGWFEQDGKGNCGAMLIAPT